jgi:hypothetical protein
MPKAAPVRFTSRTPLITAAKEAVKQKVKQMKLPLKTLENRATPTLKPTKTASP